MKNPNKHKGKKGRFIDNNNLINNLKRALYESNCRFKKQREIKLEKEKYIMDIHNFIGKRLLREFKEKMSKSQLQSQQQKPNHTADGRIGRILLENYNTVCGSANIGLSVGDKTADSQEKKVLGRMTHSKETPVSNSNAFHTDLKEEDWEDK